jgi:hypothetical protein
LATVKESATKMTVAQAKKRIEDLENKVQTLKDGAWCYLCDTHKSRDKFYVSTDPLNKSGLTPICKDCAKRLALSIGKDKVEHEPDKTSVRLALRYLNKPFLENVWDASVAESENLASGKVKSNVWAAYSKNIAMGNWNCLTYQDSDGLQTVQQEKIEESQKENNNIVREKNEEIIEQYKMNRRDIIHAIGYDPFENYPVEEDKPILYAQLNSFIDDETKNDGMKMGAVIQIVKKLNQAEKLNDQIDKYISDASHAADNMPLIDKMAGSSQKLMNVASTLAKDNGISVNFNNNKSKGANTLSGKIKKLTEIGLRDAKINSFDIGTCEGMRQVAEISEAARHKQIGYDENIAQEIKDIKIELVEKLSKERDKAVEDARKLLMENKDLKDYLRNKGLVDENYRIIEND